MANVSKRYDQVVPGSIEDMAKRNNISLEEAAANAEVIVVVDCSGSMAETMRIEESVKQRQEVARDTLIQLQAQYNGKILLVAFGHKMDPNTGRYIAEYMFNGLLPKASGMTPMDAGLELALPFDGAMDVILVSDGIPDSEQRAEAVAQRFTHPLHTIFIGDKGEDGEMFMAKLAGLTAGSHSNSATEAFKFLTKKVTLLLTGK